MAPHRSRDRALAIACIAAAIAAVASIAFVYARYMSRGEWPPGHPWSGVTLLWVSVMNVFVFRPKNTFYFIHKIVTCVATFAFCIYLIHFGLR